MPLLVSFAGTSTFARIHVAVRGGLLGINSGGVKGRMMAFTSPLKLWGGVRASQRGGLKSRSFRGSKCGCVHWSSGQQEMQGEVWDSEGKCETNHPFSRYIKGRYPSRDQGKSIFRTQRVGKSCCITRRVTYLIAKDTTLLVQLQREKLKDSFLPIHFWVTCLKE